MIINDFTKQQFIKIELKYSGIMSDTSREILILKIEYDGTRYSGWQRQNNAASVQESVENALSAIFNNKHTIIGAGRTDAGVHARGQVAHSILRNEVTIPRDKIIKAINSYLPKDIRIADFRITTNQFHATADAIAREYSYSVHTRQTVFLRPFSTFFKYPVDLSRLNHISPIFLGEHDFTTFSKNNPSTKSYICDIETCHWDKIEDWHYVLKIKANRFVYGMVRALVGVMLNYARGESSIAELEKALELKDRQYGSYLAPAQGLCLEKVYYPFEVF